MSNDRQGRVSKEDKPGALQKKEITHWENGGLRDMKCLAEKGTITGNKERGKGKRAI